MLEIIASFAILNPTVMVLIPDVRRSYNGMLWVIDNAPVIGSPDLQRQMDDGYLSLLNPPILVETLENPRLCWIGEQWLSEAKSLSLPFNLPENATTITFEKYSGKFWLASKDEVQKVKEGWLYSFVRIVFEESKNWDQHKCLVAEQVLAGSSSDVLVAQAAIYTLLEDNQDEQQEYLNWLLKINRDNSRAFIEEKDLKTQLENVRRVYRASGF